MEKTLNLAEDGAKEFPLKDLISELDFSHISKDGEIKAFDRRTNTPLFTIVVSDSFIKNIIQSNPHYNYIIRFTDNNGNNLDFSLEESLPSKSGSGEILTDESNSKNEIVLINIEDIFIRTTTTDNRFSEVSN